MNEVNNQIKFLLADDHHIVRQGIELIIEENFNNYLIFHASSIYQIINKLTDNQIDIAILDAQFPDGNIIDIFPNIKKMQANIKLLIFSSYEEEKYALKFINAGADSFLSKESKASEIKKAIESLNRTGKYISSSVEKLFLSKDYVVSPFKLLSEREVEIANLLVKGYGNLEIANYLEIKQNTVSTFKRRIFEKLKINSLIDLIEIKNNNDEF